MFLSAISKSLKFAVLLISCCVVILLPGKAAAQLTEEAKCDFSNFKPLLIIHPQADFIVKKVAPEYPPSARAAGAQGEVEVYAIIDKNGDVVEACVFKGNPLLRAAACNAARQWKFKKNLGLSAKSNRRSKRGYRQEVIVFNFNLNAK